MSIENMKKIFQTDIEPALKQIQDLCEQAGIPMIAAVAFGDGPDTGEFHKFGTSNDDLPMPPELQIARQVLMSNNGEAPGLKIVKMSIDPSQLVGGLIGALAGAVGVVPNEKGECDCPACKAAREGKLAPSTEAKH